MRSLLPSVKSVDQRDVGTQAARPAGSSFLKLLLLRVGGDYDGFPIDSQYPLVAQASVCVPLPKEANIHRLRSMLHLFQSLIQILDYVFHVLDADRYAD